MCGRMCARLSGPRPWPHGGTLQTPNAVHMLPMGQSALVWQARVQYFAMLKAKQTMLAHSLFILHIAPKGSPIMLAPELDTFEVLAPLLDVAPVLALPPPAPLIDEEEPPVPPAPPPPPVPKFLWCGEHLVAPMLSMRRRAPIPNLPCRSIRRRYHTERRREQARPGASG